VEGLDYTFHFYTADGKIYEGFTEVFVALKDLDGNFVEDFSVSNFAPVMDMGTMSHSTPVGKVEKVDGKPLYKTWFAGLMDGDWELAFDYSIEETAGKIAGASLFVSEIPAGQKWIQSFNSKYYASIAYPQSYAEGSQTLQAYINEKIVGTDPYLIVEGAYKIVVTPTFGTTVLPSVTLLWNVEKGIYEGNVNFSEEGLSTLYIKILNAENDALVAGDNGTDSNLKWIINVACGDDTGIRQTLTDSEVKVYPTLTQGDVRVVAPANAVVNVISRNGQVLQSRNAIANVPLNLYIKEKGLYLINIQTVNGEALTRKIIVK
jgi:hypothetical protein